MKHRWFLVLVRAAVATWFLLVLTTMVVAQQDTDIVISEVLYNSWCGGTDPSVCDTSSTDETRFEWVEIYNKGDFPVNLNGWQICDNRTTPTCRNLPNVTIGSHECWVIGYNATATQTELNATGHGDKWNPERYIALNNPIGNGLTNNITSGTAEAVVLRNASGTAVDCVSWANTTPAVCGSEGVNTTLNNASQATSITNIQGAWYFHGPGAQGAQQQSSPFDCNNVAAGGAPSAVRLITFTGTSPTLLLHPLVLGAFALLILFLGGLLWARQHNR